jgi:hypothetical protein
MIFTFHIVSSCCILETDLILFRCLSSGMTCSLSYISIISKIFLLRSCFTQCYFFWHHSYSSQHCRRMDFAIFLLVIICTYFSSITIVVTIASISTSETDVSIPIPSTYMKTLMMFHLIKGNGNGM